MGRSLSRLGHDCPSTAVQTMAVNPNTKAGPMTLARTESECPEMVATEQQKTTLAWYPEVKFRIPPSLRARVGSSD